MLFRSMITMKDPVWDNFVTGDWDAMTKDIRKTSGKCDISDFTAPIVISTPTKVDLTACPSVTWGRGLEFVLKSDLVVFVKGLTQNGSNTMKVRTANASGDETRHTLYIVALPESGQTECVAGKGGNITFATGGWSQFDADLKIRTKVLLYSAGKTTLSSKPSSTFSGQLYGCEVDAASGIDMVFAKAGRDFTDTLWDLEVGSVRDITRN